MRLTTVCLLVVEVTQTDTPLSVVIVFDASASMGTREGRASKLTRQALDALKRFVELSQVAAELRGQYLVRIRSSRNS